MADRISCPTLLLHGRHDVIFSLEQVEKLRRGLVNADLEIQVEEDGDHCCHNMGHIVRPRMADWLADRLGTDPVKPPPVDYAAPETLDAADRAAGRRSRREASWPAARAWCRC